MATELPASTDQPNREQHECDGEEEPPGMADALMMRGARIRAWKAMMEEAEAEAENDAAAADRNEKGGQSIPSSLADQQQSNDNRENHRNDDDDADDDCSGSDVIERLEDGRKVLKYESYLRHQRYYDDLKHVDCQFIEYDLSGQDKGRPSRSVLIEQDKSLGKGGLVSIVVHVHIICPFHRSDQTKEPKSDVG